MQNRPILVARKSNVDWVAEEHEGGCWRGTTTESPLVIINAEQRERELHLITSPDSAPYEVRVTESTQHGSYADHVEAFVAAECDDDGSYRGRRWRAEAEVFPEGVIAGDGAPEAADTGGDGEWRAIEAFEDLYEDVYVVVDEELGLFLFLFCFLLLHGLISALRERGFVCVRVTERFSVPNL